MGGYNDYCMTPPGAAQPVTGICHARRHNADLPPARLIYITVVDLHEAMRRSQERGGKLRHPPRDTGGQGRYCTIEDPAGAVTGLFEPSGQ
jgi:predicted enzyme related to lactoylglutathione lyase